MNPPLLLFLIAAVLFVIIPLAILTWFRGKEIQQLKAVEFKIIAAENDLQYMEDGILLLRVLQKRDLIPWTSAILQNALSKEYGNWRTYFFDLSFTTSSATNSARECHLVGICVEFSDLKFPSFEIEPFERFDSLTLLSNRSKVDYDYLADWYQPRYSVFQDKNISPHPVANLLRGKDELRYLIQSQSFHSFVVRNKTMILFFDGNTQSTLDYYRQLEAKALKIVDLFGFENLNLSEDNEIKLLKRSQEK